MKRLRSLPERSEDLFQICKKCERKRPAPMNKEQLVKRIERAWDALKESYEGLSDRDLMKPGVMGDWSVEGHYRACDLVGRRGAEVPAEHPQWRKSRRGTRLCMAASMPSMP